MNEITVKEKNGQLVVSSREVAERFGKEHSSVLKTIYGENRNGKHIEGIRDEVLASGNPLTKYFMESSYVNRGKHYKECLMTRDGFSLLVMGFTGKDALQWKLKYIEAFNAMEERLKSGNQLTEEERLKLQLFSKDASEVAFAHNKLIELATAPLYQKIEEQQPKALFADAVSSSRTSILIGDLAKLICQNGVNIGQKRLFEWLRANGYLIKRKGSDWNMPTQKSMEMGLFEIKESSRLDANGCNVTIRTPKATGKGQVYFINKFLSTTSN